MSIPISDAVVLVPVQVGMLAGVSAIFGIDVTRGRIAALISVLAKTGGTELAGTPLVERCSRFYSTPISVPGAPGADGE